jgi:tryptophan halogenase
MSELRPDTFRGRVAQGEVHLQFGAARNASTVDLQRDVVLPPLIALRLLSRLREAVREAERRAPIAPGDLVAQMGTTLLNAAPQEAGEQAALLFRLVDGLGAPYRHERSFRLAPDSLQSNRVLLSLGRSALGEDAAPRLAALAAQLGLPAAMAGSLAEHWSQARAVHFGFEADGARSRYKMYFERTVADEEARRAAPGTPVLLHLAWKWNPADPADCVITHYHWLPRLDAAALRGRMERLYGPGAPLEAALAVLELAAARVAAEKLQFLQVSEEGSPRLSFDLNLYDAGLTVRDAQGPLARLREHFAVRPGQYQALYDQVRALPLGHLAGGVHRDGAAFATVYYGVQRRG